MIRHVIVIGIGEMGAVFSHALLRSGHPVVPVLRSTPIDGVAHDVPDPALVVVAVGEDELPETLESLPPRWKANVAFIQNELLPDDWLRFGIDAPTVAVVWFEKKPGRVPRVIVPTPISGPHAGLLVAALATVDLPAVAISDDRLLDALVAKNLYILTANIGGLRTGGTVEDLWNGHRAFARTVAVEVLEIQESLIGIPIDRDRAIAAMAAAIDADPDHLATGRSAPRRLARALAAARAAGLTTPVLDDIGREVGLSV